MQVLEKELRQCHEELQATFQGIISLTEENKELREQLRQYQSHPDLDDAHTDMEATGIWFVTCCIWMHQYEIYVCSGFLRGVDVLGQTSLVITSQAQTFHWLGYGLKLHIPQGSLPADLKECRLHIKVSLSGEFEFPQNTSLVSAVYWIDSMPRRKFSKPIRMELQHCSNRNSKLSIVRAKCSQEFLPYTFTRVEEGECTPHQMSSYASIQLSHFSMIGVTQEGEEDPQYCASFYYNSITLTKRRVYFVITKDLEVFNTVSSANYIVLFHNFSV